MIFFCRKSYKNLTNFRNSIIGASMERRQFFSIDSTKYVKQFATVDPYNLSSAKSHHVMNLVDGKWSITKNSFKVVDPLSGDPFIISPYTQGDELIPFIDSLNKVPKSGLHNPFKNPERYLLYGKVMQKAAEYLHKEEVLNFFVKCIQRTMPKSEPQAAGEVIVLRNFFENFSGDSVRFLVKGFSVPGDRIGQMSNGYRWPYGACCVISPFNFPLEIPIMQVLGGLFVGNKILLKTESTQGMPVEQFIRFLHFCGLPKDDLDFINTRADQINVIFDKTDIRLVQFTGGSDTANKLTQKLVGKVRLEDAGYDWKVLGHDVGNFSAKEIDYVAYQCDMDAYSMSGQKCSAQSILLMHKNWDKVNLIEKLRDNSMKRSLQDLTLSPVLSHTTEEMLEHIDKLLALKGSALLFGGQRLTSHKIPPQYGAIQPTAVYVPLDTILSSPQSLALCTKEIFGPLQIISKYEDHEVESVIKILEKISHHLTAGIVSKDINFMNHMISNTVNGTTYAGLRARTTGAPQNHWFGPAGDPRGAGIGTKEAILHTWTCHREIINDYGPIPESWEVPQPT